MKKIILSFIALLCTLMSNAQIGYQVSLLNTATGEPRANETVSCTIELKNSEGAVVCSETKSETSNDFGVLSLSVGNDETFTKMDWSKLPLYVSVTIGGKLVGQSQVLTVPVAEYAKKTGTLTYDNIHEKKIVGYAYGEHIHTWTFHGNTVKVIFESGEREYNGIARIDGNTVFGYVDIKGAQYTYLGHYSPEDDKIYIILTNTK